MRGPAGARVPREPREEPTMAKPIISADSHITEPPDCYTTYIDPKFREHAPHIVDSERRATSSSSRADEADRHGARGRRRQSPPRSCRCSASASRTCTARAGTPTRAWRDQERDGITARDPLPDRRHDAVQPPGLRLTSRRASTPTTAGSASTARRIPIGCSGIGQSRDALGRGRHRDLQRMKDLGLRGVMMPGNPGARPTTTTPIYDPFFEAAIDLGCRSSSTS